MDNAPIHHARIINQYLGEKINVFFNCAYTPELNPIEELFN